VNCGSKLEAFVPPLKLAVALAPQAELLELANQLYRVLQLFGLVLALFTELTKGEQPLVGESV
jgi:hypothetical protein